MWYEESWNTKELKDLTQRELVIRHASRMRQLIHIYSIAYYSLGGSDVSDARWDEWSAKLVAMQTQFPWVKFEGYEHEVFYDWTGDTGMHLPVTEWALTRAYDVLVDEAL